MFRAHPCIRALALAGLLAATGAQAASVELSGGAVLPAPADARRLETGWLAEFSFHLRGTEASQPRLVLSHGVSRSAGGRLYFFPPSPVGTLQPYRDDADVVRTTALEAAMRHVWQAARGRARAYVEGRSGLAWIGWHAIHAELTNDRRPDPAPNRRRAHGLGATTSVGAGLSLDLISQLAFGLDGAACSIITDGVAQPRFPLRGALSWSSGSGATATSPAGKDPPRLSLGAGTAWLSRPSGLREGVRPNLDWSVALEYPCSASLSFVLTGGHQAFTSREAFVLREETDNAGNLVVIHADQAPTWALTTFECGLELRHEFRSWSPYARLAAGLARTGGQGLTVVERAFTIGPGGNPVITATEHRIGFGDSRVGAMGGVALGARCALTRALALFAEAGVQGIAFHEDDVLTLPLHAGLTLR